MWEGVGEGDVQRVGAVSHHTLTGSADRFIVHTLAFAGGGLVGGLVGRWFGGLVGRRVGELMS